MPAGHQRDDRTTIDSVMAHAVRCLGSAMHMQAFRHSYSLSLEWRYWEPLVLMIDEVYRSHAEVRGATAAMQLYCAHI